jgi:peptidoglycan/xylan/chitin deacetylase (PgdA/CDA1 family)
LTTGVLDNQTRMLYLLYHEIRATEYSYAIDPDTFREHVTLFARRREANDSRIRPEVTFDDGHLSDVEIAAPILESHGLKAHFFITAGWTGTKAGYMDWPQLRMLHQAGHRIGAHGWSHKLLTHCSDAELEGELSRSRKSLEDGLGSAVTTMSLPGGRCNRKVLAACKAAGYTRVYTSVPELAGDPSAFTVGRVNILGTMRPEWIAGLFIPGSPTLHKLARMYRTKNAVKAIVGDALYERLWSRLNRSDLDRNESGGVD